MRVKMCSIHVTDPSAAHAFYTGTLGFEDLLVMPEANLYIVRSPQDRDGVGLLLEPSDFPAAAAYRDAVKGAGMPAIVFGVPDVASEYARLSGLGVQFTREPVTDPSGTSAVLDDTCGNLVQLHQD